MRKRRPYVTLRCVPANLAKESSNLRVDLSPFDTETAKYASSYAGLTQTFSSALTLFAWRQAGDDNV